MENMFLRTVLRTTNILGKSKTQKKKKKGKLKPRGQDRGPAGTAVQGWYMGIQPLAAANKRVFLLHQDS